MRVMAQVAMVMNLDKCIGCHTCSVTCKQTWSNRPGVEYAWFNNVETKPGVGYPRGYEDQEHWKGGWMLDRRGRLVLRSGGRVKRLLSLFSNPDLPSIDDYYEPVTYEYDTLVDAPVGTHVPVARPRSVLTGEPTAITWGPNWEDGLGGAEETAGADPNLRGSLAEKVKFEFEQTFMFHLPRLCEHCLNPACVSACPSGAMYKREEDGIVLVDQDRCRGWRMCVTACPYKKVYVNHATGKAEKCTFCFPRIEAGQPTVCSETCVGRLRYLGLVLYDADRVGEAAAVQDEHDLLDAQRNVFLDPSDPEVIAAARRDGIAEDWLEAARRSPVYALISRFKVALPLHPEYRTLPMVWYVPPLSPVLDAVGEAGGNADDPDHVFAAVTRLRIPLEYLANLFSAGDTDVVAGVLMKLTALRSHMRAVNLGETGEEAALAAVGLDSVEAEDLHRLLAIAKYEDRYVIPAAHKEDAAALSAMENRCPVESSGDEPAASGKVMLGLPRIRRRDAAPETGGLAGGVS
ncbi:MULTISPECIES: nitrate reductase subunit beta [Streptomyces]|uniref:Nitrate reductase subunit beta n=2 Tax=Streptomyces TaxID=1883 RepID=A0A3M8ESG0_9ACTN|nr:MULTISPECIES: nitrate reductase subunit beta [Streptomyces]MZE75849.1 nitrate reductase subunit beta [Streptomyces sp. SID5475]KNE79761.1 nitrate reductase [Streptomyces fradiae]OFA43452.1 nitrate reductase subunit beta [Streptomyces fradiae]PQM19631.1 nitrate reductase subunit beta [Streptomyces xinghaiensis]RKM90167.1 nitrate reductase subunit beta [Streptomyces xinghaiensis]